MASVSERTAEQLNSILPVHLGASDVEENPQFANLLNVLSRFITEDGTTTSVQKELEQAQSELKYQKTKWLQQHVLYREIEEFLLDNHLSDTSDSQFYKAINEMMTFAEISDYLSCNPDPSSDVTLLGITEEDINFCNKHKKHKGSIQQKLIPEIELRLRKRCEDLVSFYYSCTTLETDTSDKKELALSRVEQLPSLLEDEQLTLEESKRILHMTRSRIDRMMKVYMMTLMESFEILEKIITLFKLHCQAESDTVFTEWLSLRSNALCAKAKLLQMDLMCDIYNSDNVRALTVIRSELDQVTKETEEKIVKTQQILKAYESVGTGFDQLLDEYMRLSADLENKKWTLQMVKRREEELT